MLKRIFVLFLYAIGCSYLLGVTPDSRVFNYIRNNAVMCFDKKLSNRREMISLLSSSNVNDLVSCVSVCCTMIRQSLLESPYAFNKVVALLSDANVPPGLDTSETEKIFEEMNSWNAVGGDCYSNDLRKLALLAPVASRRLSLKQWLKRFELLSFSDKSTLCDSNEYSERYPYSLEFSLCMMFSAVHFNRLFDSTDDKCSYVKCMCTIVKSYLHFVEGIDVMPWQKGISCTSVLLRCYDCYSVKGEKKSK